MDIYILRQDQETGPYSAEEARTLLSDGSVAESDFAWHEGLPSWCPLGDLLSPTTSETENAEEPASHEQPAAPAAANTEPATAKQKALLSFLGIALPPDLMRDQAALLVNDAMEDPKNAARLTQWNEERLRLHPDLFAAEIQAKKENRAAHFLELCHSTGADYFAGITKAHCQVLVGFLDVKFPHWDSREDDAAEHYFFPAVAEKFPQLVNKQWRGRLHYAASPRATHRSARQSPSTHLRRTGTSPLVAITRGLVLGAAILAGLYLAHRTFQPSVASPPAENSIEVAPQAAPPPPPAETTPIATLADEPTIAPLPSIAATNPAPAEPAPAPQMPVPPPAPTPEPAAMAAIPAAPIPSPEPISPPPTPVAAMASFPMDSPAVATAPMAALPGSEPPVPLPPPPATMPTAGTLAGLPPEAAAIPPLSPGELPPATPPVPSVKTSLLLTKPVEVQLAYGKVTLPPGTPVKLVERQGSALKVSYGTSVMTVPATSTDAD